MSMVDPETLPDRFIEAFGVNGNDVLRVWHARVHNATHTIAESRAVLCSSVGRTITLDLISDQVTQERPASALCRRSDWEWHERARITPSTGRARYHGAMAHAAKGKVGQILEQENVRQNEGDAVACSAVVQTGKKWLGPARQGERVFEFLGRYRFAKPNHERDCEQSRLALGTVVDDRYDLACRLGSGAYHSRHLQVRRHFDRPQERHVTFGSNDFPNRMGECRSAQRRF